MIIFWYAKCHGDRVKHNVSVEHVEVGAKQNVIIDDVTLSGKEKSLLCSLD